MLGDNRTSTEDPTRDPLPPPFPVGTQLRCVEGHDAYVPNVVRPRDLKDHPEDWARVSGRGLEVTIARVEPGHRGTGRQLRDEDGPVCSDDGEPLLDETHDGYSVYQVVRGVGDAARMSGRCIFPDSAHKWQVLSSTSGDAGLVVKPGDFVREGIDLGLVLVSGAKTFDVIWMGGSTTRCRHGERDIQIVPPAELDVLSREHLTKEAEAARSERRKGLRIKRGTVSPRR